MDDVRFVQIQRAKVLLDRLERLSADSRYAHQASGLRGGLLRILSGSGYSLKEAEVEQFRTYLEKGDDILRKAAAEIPES